MGHRKLKKFAENETFKCLLQPDSAEILADGFFSLKDHPVKGHWNEMMFDAERPIIVELGCGRGEYTVDLARRNPQYNYIGVDIKGARLWKGAKEATEAGLGNVAFLRTRIEFITAFFGKNEIAQIWLTFSDPQLKSENCRLTSRLFLERYASFLEPGGMIHLKTDSQFLHEYTKAIAACNDLPVYASSSDLYATARTSLFPQGWPGVEGESEANIDALYEVHTFYETMFMAQGYKITYMCFGLGDKSTFVAPLDPDQFDSDHWRSIEGPRHFAPIL